MLFCLACVWLVARWAITRTTVVRTVHNVIPHETQTWYQRAASRLLSRAEATRIYLTASSLAQANDPRGHIVKHGRYREWFDSLGSNNITQYAETGVVPDDTPIILFFGMVRPYKGVEELLSAFGQMSRPARLRVVGKPSTAQYQAQIEELASHLNHVELDLRHVPDDELWAALHTATLIVLPFRKITNSGSLILALDAAVPVLVSDSPTARELADEVGEQWLRIYPNELTGDILNQALIWASTPRASEPDLSSREWQTIGRQYVTVYQKALAK